MPRMFIVLEGLDRAGKFTQLRLLFKKLVKDKVNGRPLSKRGFQPVLGGDRVLTTADNLAGENVINTLVSQFKDSGLDVVTFSFPQYHDTFWGRFIGKALRGEFGAWDKENPYLASIPYALDRFAVSRRIKRALNEGKIVIADRYTTSNYLYQASKIDSELEQARFIDWLEDLEYRVLKIPRPDIVFFLDVMPEITMERDIYDDAKKRYLKNAKDVNEENIDLQMRAYKMALKLSEKWPNYFVRVRCVDAEGEVLKPEIISEQIYNFLKPILEE